MPRAFELGGVRWWTAAGADEAAVRRAVGGALDALAGGRARNLKGGRRKALYPLALEGGAEPDHLLKVSAYAGAPSVRRRLFGSKARRELRLAQAIARRGVATPVPLAAGERRAGGRVRACYLLVALVPGARDLRRLAAEPALRGAERRALARAFGAFARRLHDAGVVQDDFQPNNFLRRADGDLLFIDCERVRLRPRVSRHARAAMLAKLERELAGARLAERARFLRAYARGDRAEARRWWRAVERAARELAARDAGRLARLVARPGRRFVPLEVHGWRGVRVAGADADALAQDLDVLIGAREGARRHFARGFQPRGAADASRALARALLLARRGLGPDPVAVLERRRAGAHAREALLVFDGPLRGRLDALDAAARCAALPALTRFLARVAAYGSLAGLPSPHDVGRLARGLALLDPHGFRPGGAGGLPDRRTARALAARILGVPDA